MYMFQYQGITYKENAPGWVDGVYRPRPAGACPADLFLEKAGEMLKLHSRVWREIEETGFGVYYYEETVHLTAVLTGSNYTVQAVLANPNPSTYTCHIRFNGVVKNPKITVAPGEEKRVVFTACVTDGSFDLSFPAGAMASDGAAGEEQNVVSEKVIEGDVYLKDVEVVPQAVKARREKPHVFLVSDSTVQSYGEKSYPQTGWGQVFYRFFKGAEECRVCQAQQCDYSLAKTYELPELVIENRAIGGRSARSFYDEGKLDQILEVICPGDFMFVQFAHNDDNALRPNRYIAPEEFPAFLQRYVDACERRGVQCVLVTPVTMRIKGRNGRFQIAFNNYRIQMMGLAAERDIPLLDLGARSTDFLNEIGDEASKEIYLWAAEGEYPDGAYAAGVSDNAHLQEYGAMVYANMVTQMIEQYRRDDKLDVLKGLVEPKEIHEIEKPAKHRSHESTESCAGRKQEAGAGTGEQKAAETAAGFTGQEAAAPEFGFTAQETAERVTGFVVQEISAENGRGSFLLNWDCRDNTASYAVYARKKGEADFAQVRIVTREEKERTATLPFSAEAGFVWEYYVEALPEEGGKGGVSQVIEVEL